MYTVKKSILIMVVLALFVCLSVAANALETPKIPAKPDSQTTESSSPTTNGNDDAQTTTQNGSGDVVTDGEQKVEADDEQDELTGSGASDAQADGENAEKIIDTVESKGCGSVLGGSIAAICCLASGACFIRSRKETK